jgi:hypothetical protein
MPEIYPYSATVTVGNSVLRVRSAPNTSAPLAGSQYLNPGVKVQVKGWTYGECVSGECRWWVSMYGNYFWAGGTIEKPPGTPTPPAPTPPGAPSPPPPPTAPTPAPSPPREYRVSAPLVAFSQVLPVTFYPEDKIEIRAFNVDDIARVYVDNRLVLTVGYKGDQKVQINPGLSIGNHSIRLTVENTGGGWTYGFDVLKNGSSVLSSPFKEGEAGVRGAKNNDLGIGLVVDIRLGITISAPPQKQQEAFEWLFQTQQQITQETALSTKPYLTPEEAAEIKWVPEWKDVPAIIGFMGSIFLKNPYTEFLLTEKGASGLQMAEKIVAGEKLTLVAVQVAQKTWLRRIVEIATKPLSIASRAFSLISYAFSVFTGISIVTSMARNPLFWFDPDLWMDNYVNVYLPDLKPSLLLIKNRIPEIYKKVEEISEKVAPLTGISSKIDQLPKEIEKIKVTPEEIEEKLKPRLDLIASGIGLSALSLTTVSQSLTLLSNSLTSAETAIKREIQTQTQSVPSQIIPELTRIKTQLEFSIPNNVLGRIAQGLSDVGFLSGFGTALLNMAGIAALLGLADLYLKNREEFKKQYIPGVTEFFEEIYDLGDKWAKLMTLTGKSAKDTFVSQMSDIAVITFIGYLIQNLLGSLAGLFWKVEPAWFGALLAPYASFRVITNRIITRWTDVSLARPLRWTLNTAFPTEIPTAGEVLLWHARGLLEPSQWEKAKRLYGEIALPQPQLSPEAIDSILRMRGYKDEYISVLKVRAFRPIDPFSFAFLSQTGYFVPEEIDFLTRDMGYRPEVRDYLVKAPMMWGLSPFKTSIRTRMMNAVSDGFIEEEKAVRILEKLWRILDMKTVMLLEAQTRYWYDTTKDRVDQLIDKAVKDIISEDELRRALSTGPKIHLSATVRGEERLEENLIFAVVNPEKLESYIERVRIRKYRKPLEERLPEQKRFILSALINLYSIGRYDATKFVETLNKADTITDFIELAKLRADLEKELDDYREELRRQKDELKNYLSLIAGILVSEYREGAITLDVLEQRLSEAEKIKDRKIAYIKKAEYERELEEFREQKRLEREEVKNYISVVASTLIDCYEEGAITFDRLQSELDIAEQITSRKAAYILKAQWSRFLKEFREQRAQDEEKVREYLSTVAGSIINAFEKGYIDYDTMTSELEFAESVTDKKVAYALKGLWERFNREMDMKINNLRASLDAGMITEGSFYDELKKLGVQEWRIQAEIENHEIKTYGKAISVEAKWLSEYRAAMAILDKIKRAGFMTMDRVRYEANKIRQMLTPLEILRERRILETFYDTQRIRVESLAEQYFIDLIDEANLYNELKKIIAVQDILDRVFLQIKGEKAKREKEREKLAQK